MAVVSKVFRLNHVWSAVMVAATIGVASDALAQQPSQTQLNALRSSCRNDYMAHCSSVPTGGAPALNCLKQHITALSGACQSAVSAISPKAPAPSPVAAPVPAAAPPPTMQAAPVPPPTMQAAPAAPAPAAASAPAVRKANASQRQAELKAIARACRADYKVHCAGIVPGGSAAFACLRRNAHTLSKPCLEAIVGAANIAAAPGHTPPVTAPAPLPAPVAVRPEPAPLLVTPREEAFMLRNACGADYARFCRGLRPGLGRIAACLHYNKSNLSPRCQQTLVALQEGRKLSGQ
jgi:hypothetical protein